MNDEDKKVVIITKKIERMRIATMISIRVKPNGLDFLRRINESGFCGDGDFILADAIGKFNFY